MVLVCMGMAFIQINLSFIAATVTICPSQHCEILA